MKKALTTLLILLITVAVANANQPDVNDANTVRKIIVSGTGDSQKLMRALADAFMQKHNGKYIVEVPDAVGSTAGVKALIAGEIDIARIARPLKETERQHDLNYQIFANTAIVFVTNPSVMGIDNITTEQIVAVYSGKITDWKGLGAAPGKIYPLTREPGDSSLRVFSETLPEFTNIHKPVAKVMYLTPETVDTLLRYKNTIGFVPYSSAVGKNLKILKVNGIEPSDENVTGGQYRYLIPLGVAYKGPPEGLTKEFVDFLYSKEARKIIKKMGAVSVKQDTR